MTLALHRADELRLHLRAAPNKGVTRDEVKETRLHSTICCGVPAANSDFHIARKAFAEQDADAAAQKGSPA